MYIQRLVLTPTNLTMYILPSRPCAIVPTGSYLQEIPRPNGVRSSPVKYDTLLFVADDL